MKTEPTEQAVREALLNRYGTELGNSITVEGVKALIEAMKCPT